MLTLDLSKVTAVRVDGAWITVKSGTAPSIDNGVLFNAPNGDQTVTTGATLAFIDSASGQTVVAAIASVALKVKP